jgi:hypothetical protein
MARRVSDERAAGWQEFAEKSSHDATGDRLLARSLFINDLLEDRAEDVAELARLGELSKLWIEKASEAECQIRRLTEQLKTVSADRDDAKRRLRAAKIRLFDQQTTINALSNIHG